MNKVTDSPDKQALVDETRQDSSAVLSPLWYTVPGTLFIIFTAYTWIWPSFAGPSDLSGRLAFAIQCAFFALLPFVATSLTLVIRRVRDGVLDPLAGQDGRALRVHQLVTQNTLHHFVWFAVSGLAISTRLTANEMRILPILTGVFIAARFLYWWSFVSSGAVRRAPAGQITLTVNVGLFLATIAVFAIRGVA